MPKPNERFAEAVKQVLDDHGLTARGQRPRTGLSHVTVGTMLQGVVPQMETVVAFAQGFQLNVNDWLELAGYDRIEDPVMVNALDATESLLQGLRELQDDFPTEVIPIPRFATDARNLTPSEVASILTNLRKRVEERRQASAGVSVESALECTRG